jgi:hypothetical protein
VEFSEVWEIGHGETYRSEALMNWISTIYTGLMVGAALAAIAFWIYGFCRLASSWFADNTILPDGFMLFDGGLREILWPTIRGTPSKPLSAAAIHRHKATRAGLLFVGAWLVGVFARMVGTLFEGWGTHEKKLRLPAGFFRNNIAKEKRPEHLCSGL